MAPGQNYFKCNICTKANILRKKKESIYSLIPMSYMEPIGHDLAQLKRKEKETQKKLSKTKNVIIFLFFHCFYFLAFVEILASIR